MGEGIIGLIIMIILFNVVGRVLKVLTSQGPRQGDRGAQRPTAPPRTPQQQILEELLELQREREQAIDQRAAHEETQSAGVAAASEERTPKREGKPGDLARWSEDSFEQRAAAPAYMPQPWLETAPAIERISSLPLDSIATPFGSSPRRETIRRDGIRGMLASPSRLGRAVLLSVILGPCRARRPHR